MSIENIRNLKLKAAEPKERKTYSIPKISEKRKKKIEADKEVLKLDEELRRIVWLASAHVCQNCGIHLGNKYKKWNFHHLLLKSKYPSLRHEPANIAILCLQCHSKCETDLDTIPKIKLRTQQAEKELLKSTTI